MNLIIDRQNSCHRGACPRSSGLSEGLYECESSKRLESCLHQAGGGTNELECASFYRALLFLRVFCLLRAFVYCEFLVYCEPFVFEPTSEKSARRKKGLN